jgi:hypothetical protein
MQSAAVRVRNVEPIALEQEKAFHRSLRRQV